MLRSNLRKQLRMSLKVPILWASFVLMAVPAVFGQQADTDTLSVEEAVRIAMENNFSIRIVGNQSDIAANNMSLGNAGFLPALTATGSRNYRTENSTQVFAGNSIPDRTTEGAKTTTTNASVSLNWTVFDGLGMFTTYEKLGELQQLGEEQFRLSVENTMAQVMAAYYNIIRQQKTYDVLQSTVEVSEQRIRIAETKKDLGSGSEYDLLQARADLNADRAAVIRQEVLLADAKIELNELLGRDPETEVNVSRSIAIDRELQYDNLEQQALTNNIDLMLARTNQKIAELEIKEIQAERFPELDVTAGYGYNRNESGAGFLELSESDGFNYGLTARINLFDGFDVSRRIQNAKIRLKNRELALEELEQQVKARLSRQFVNYINSLRLVELETENLTYAQQSLEIALERFQLGTINSIELREVQRTLIAAENRLIQAQYEAKVAETELLRISGGLVHSE